MTTRYFRKTLQIRAEDAPTVQAGLRGEECDFPGIITMDEYRHRRKTWDDQRQCEGLDARWFVGAAVMLVPEPWWDAAVRVKRPALVPYNPGPRWLGVDPGEGGDPSAWCVIDYYGLLELVSFPTPDTNKVVGFTMDFARKWQVPPENIIFDRGGGGKEHADRLRTLQWNVRTVGFGEPVKVEPKRGIRVFGEKRDTVEEKYASVNRRSEMYYDIRMLLECDRETHQPIRRPPFHVPMSPMTRELKRQLTLIPMDYDNEGRFKLWPKRDAKKAQEGETNTKTLLYILGRSPDEADAFALAVFGMLHKPITQRAGVS